MSGGGGLGIAHLADVETVSVGGPVEIFTATDLKLNRTVSVQKLGPLARPADRDRFDRESKAVGQVSAHPNVVTIFEAGFAEDGRPYLVTELVDGIDLTEYLDRHGPLPWQQAVDVALHVAAGLEQAHGSGTLHKRLQPSKIRMVGAIPKIADFTVTALSTSGGPDGETAIEEMGRLLHGAPETLEDSWDERSDLYSLTSILYQMVDGSPPFGRPGEDSSKALSLRLTHEAPPNLSTELAPDALDLFVKAGLAKDPLDRPQTAAEFLHELRLVRQTPTADDGVSVLHSTTSTIAIMAPPSRPVATVGSPMAPDTVSTNAVSTNAVSTDGSPMLFGDQPDHGLARSGAIEPDLAPLALSREPVEHLSPQLDIPPARPEMAPQAMPLDSHTSVYDVAGTGVAGGGPMAPPAPSQKPSGIDTNPQRARSEPGSHLGDRTGTFDTIAPKTSDEGRSPILLVAIAMVAIGLIGLAAVLAASRLGSDDTTETAPLLPPVTDPSELEAAGDAGVSTPAEAMVDGEAAPAEPEATTTTVEAEAMESTTTTIPRVQIPNLVGLDVQAATQVLGEQGLDVIVIGRVAPNAQPGVVTQQKPDAGDMVTLPLSVTLYIPKTSSLPAMNGRTASSVCAELQALGLRCVQVSQNDPQVQAGNVISSNPGEGQPFTEGSSVELVVSKGPVVNVAVPEVANLSREEAEMALGQAGFSSFEFLVEPSEAIEKDKAVRTNPAVGSSLATDQSVTVYLSSGPPAKVNVPNVVGMPQADAEAALTAAGLTVNVTTMDLPAGDAGIGNVLSTTPEAGAEVNTGTAIALTVGKQIAEEANNSTENSENSENSE